MVYFATRFLKQLEQNEKAPKQITSRYLSKQSSVLFNKVLFNKDLPKNSYLFVEPRKKDCILNQKRTLSAQNPLKMVI